MPDERRRLAMDLIDADDVATVGAYLRSLKVLRDDWPTEVRDALHRLTVRADARRALGPWLCPCGYGHARQHRQNPAFLKEWLRLQTMTWRDVVAPSGLGMARIREILGPDRDWAASCEVERICRPLDCQPAALFPSMAEQFQDLDPPPNDLDVPRSWLAIRAGDDAEPGTDTRAGGATLK